MSEEHSNETKIFGKLKHRNKFHFLKDRYYWLEGNKLIISPTSSIEDASKEIQISKSTVINLIDKEKYSEMTIETKKGPYILQGSRNDVLKCFCALTDCKNVGLSMEDFEILEFLGKGFYGKVLKVRKKDTNEIYAIKTIRKKRLIELDQVSTIEAERSITLIQNNPFIIKLCFAFQNQHKFYLGLEYAEGGELLDSLRRMSILQINEIRIYIAEIILALEHLHKNNYIYRDLKPSNILLDETGHIKITDFGLSKDVSDSNGLAETFCGTYEYMAPEIIQHLEYDYKVDLWSLGVVFYEILTGETPFASDNQQELFNNIINEEVEFNKYMHRQAAQLIKKLLNKNPANRPTFEELKADPFFRPINWDDILAKKYNLKHFDENCFPSNGSDGEPVDSLVTTKDGSNDNLQFSNFSFGPC